MKLFVLPENEWNEFVKRQIEILQLVKDLKNGQTSHSKLIPYITAIEFMQAVKIGRTKFDQLVLQKRIRIIKKDRKIYVPIEEVETYFKSA